MYKFQSRVRYSETDTDAKLSITGIMNYLQDCSTFHSEDSGVGLSYLEREKKIWLLSSWQIRVLRRPELGEEITVATWPYDFKGIYGMRNFAVHDRDGAYLVKANSCWFLMNTEEGRPIRVSKKDVEAYGAEEPKLFMDYGPRKISLPEHMEEAGRILVTKHQIDTNHHVNNAQYVDMAREVVPEGTEIGEIRAEYKKAAVLGDWISLRAAREDGNYVVSLRSEDGTVYANVELREKREDEGHD